MEAFHQAKQKIVRPLENKLIQPQIESSASPITSRRCDVDAKLNGVPDEGSKVVHCSNKCVGVGSVFSFLQVHNSVLRLLSVPFALPTNKEYSAKWKQNHHLFQLFINKHKI